MYIIYHINEDKNIKVMLYPQNYFKGNVTRERDIYIKSQRDALIVRIVHGHQELCSHRFNMAQVIERKVVPESTH